MVFEVEEASGDEDGGSELSDVEDVFVGDEAELPKKLYYDVRPSKEQVELHNLTHLPYRIRCPPIASEAKPKDVTTERNVSHSAVVSLLYQSTTCG